MEEILKFIVEIEPFETQEGIMCIPVPVEGGWFLPLGWESTLFEMDVDFEVIEIAEQPNPLTGVGTFESTL
jgi:hypothetical protein